MTTSFYKLFTVLFISFFSFSSLVHSADIEAGKNKAEVCQGCHGIEGKSQSAFYPNLAGQRALYLENQLKAFQSGRRINPMMQSMAKNLSKQEIKNISAYFASITLEKDKKSPLVDIKGKNKITMCLGCHGSTARGMANFPRLAGQQSAYLKKQLLNFKNKTRKGGPMNSIASSLSEQDIDEIVTYLGSL